MTKKELWLLSVKLARIPLCAYFRDPDGFDSSRFMKKENGEGIVKKIYSELLPLLITSEKKED